MRRLLAAAVLAMVLLAAASPLLAHSQGEEQKWVWVIYGVEREGGTLPFNITLLFPSGCTMNVVVLATDTQTTLERFQKERAFDIGWVTVVKPGIFVDKVSEHCSVDYKTVEYPVIYGFETFTYIALLLSEKPYGYAVNSVCIVELGQAGPQLPLPVTEVSTDPPETFRFVEASFDEFYSMVKDVKETLEEVSGGGFSWLANIGNWLNAVFSVVIQSLNMVSSGIRLFVRSVAGVGEAFRVAFQFIGKPGDPAAAYYANMYRAQLQMVLASLPLEVRADVEKVLSCEKPLHTVKGLLKSYREEDLKKSICEIEESSPRGVVGALTSALSALTLAKDVVAMVARHFVEINAAIIATILAYKTSLAIKKKDPSQLVEGVKWVYSIFKFYWSIMVGVVKLILQGAQAIAQAITAAHAISDAVKTLVEKIITAVKWIATVVAALFA